MFEHVVYRYVDSDNNTRNLPLIPNDKKNKAKASIPNKSVDLTKDDKYMTASTDKISKLTQELAFLRKEFNESIKIKNDKIDVKNILFLNKVSTLEKLTTTSI